jgi:transcriptional regulator with XRE-family HTH domain
MNILWHRVLRMSFSDRLATIRKTRKMTQQKMADAIGIHVSQIKRYESGDTQPSLEVLRKIALALNVSADLLLFDQQERGPDDELRLQFEAVTRFTPEEKKISKAVLESLILKHDANRFSAAG